MQLAVSGCNMAFPSNQVICIAAADNVGCRDLKATIQKTYGDAVEMRPLPSPDASGIDCSKVSAFVHHCHDAWVQWIAATGTPPLGLGAQTELEGLSRRGWQAATCTPRICVLIHVACRSCSIEVWLV